ncbi:hypothetical protein [Viscerimonas tarda]
MKKIYMFFIALFFVAVGVAGCGDDEDKKDSAIHLGDAFTVKINESITLMTENNDVELTIGLKKILNDGRCYKSQCELSYGSRADIQISVTKNGETSDIDLSIWGCIDEENENSNAYKDTLGYRIRLLRLDPYPDEGTNNNPLDYKSKLKIKKL